MKENKILISILVPTYNRVRYLEECLDSIVEQQGFDLKDLELIVSDNSEGDETKNLMEKYIKENKNWNILYNKNEKNLGMVGNWNKLLELKKGEYFIFLSDDDKFYDENSLKTLYDGLLEYKLDACYSVFNIVNDYGLIIGKEKVHSRKIKDSDIYIDNYMHQLFLFSIGFGGVLYKDFGYRYCEGANFSADWNMNLQYLYNKKSIGLINKDTFCYRKHDSQLSKLHINSRTIWRTILFNYSYFRVNYFTRLLLILLTIFRSVFVRVRSFLNV